MKKRKRIAILTQPLDREGGVATVTSFLYSIIRESNEYDVDIIASAVSSRDTDSVRLLSPRSWFASPSISNHSFRGMPWRRIGCFFAEIELQRYRPRRMLTELLDGYDLVQVVAGGPALTLSTRHVNKPVCLQVATRAASERASALRWGQPLYAWRKLMTALVAKSEVSAIQIPKCIFVENSRMLHWVQQVSPAQVILARPGVDEAQFRPGTKDSEPYILCVGRLADPRKNVKLLFSAYKELLESRKSVPDLHLAGQPPSEAQWRYAQELGVGSRIQVHADVSQSELIRLYQGARMSVLSSDEEGLGMVILEAMSCGIPVVSTRCGGPAEIISDRKTGLLCASKDPRALAAAMAEILENRSLSESLGRAAREVVLREHSRKPTGEKFLNVYRSFLSPEPGLADKPRLPINQAAEG